jgi:hypothetical protein
MTLRQSNNPPNGEVHTHRTEKGETYDVKVFAHKELIMADQAATAAYYCDGYGDYVKMCEDFAPNFDDKTTGCYMTTMHSLILPFSSGFLNHDCRLLPSHP